MDIKVVVPASGTGSRLGGKVPKQFLHIDSVPILKHTLDIFENCPFVSEIAIAVPEGYISHVKGYGLSKVRHIVIGRDERAESVYAALKCFSQVHNNPIVLIHDGIRMFITGELIAAVAESAQKYGAAVAAAPVTETIKQVDETGKILATPDRRGLWRAQTPQGFTYDIIMNAYSMAEAGGYLSLATDDSALVEHLCLPVCIVPGNPENIKITNSTDLIIARALFDAREAGEI